MLIVFYFCSQGANVTSTSGSATETPAALWSGVSALMDSMSPVRHSEVSGYNTYDAVWRIGSVSQLTCDVYDENKNTHFPCMPNTSSFHNWGQNLSGEWHEQGWTVPLKPNKPNQIPDSSVSLHSWPSSKLTRLYSHVDTSHLLTSDCFSQGPSIVLWDIYELVQKPDLSEKNKILDLHQMLMGLILCWDPSRFCGTNRHLWDHNILAVGALPHKVRFK